MDSTTLAALAAFALVTAVVAFVLLLLPRLRGERPTREQRRDAFVVFVTQMVFFGALITLKSSGWVLGGWTVYLLVGVFTAATLGVLWFLRRFDA